MNQRAVRVTAGRRRRRKEKGQRMFIAGILLVITGCMFWKLYSGVAGDSNAENPPAQTLPGDTANQTAEKRGDSWELKLVNIWNPMEADYVPSLTEVGNNEQFDSRAAAALKQMLADCRAAGETPIICSAYRSVEQQQQLYENQVADCLAAGTISHKEAEQEAAKTVAIPGTSEHNLGLAADIVDASYQILDREQENTAVFIWLKEHCSEYGFILRYPNEKTHVTGVIYEPWHFRYVGTAAAAEIMEGGLCLEEYLEEH